MVKVGDYVKIIKDVYSNESINPTLYKVGGLVGRIEYINFSYKYPYCVRFIDRKNPSSTLLFARSEFRILTKDEVMVELL